MSFETLEKLGDAQLVAECKRGSEAAFEVLFRRYRGKVYAIAFSVTKNREEALDIVQDAFTKVFRYLGHFKGEASFYTWLYRITMNLCLDRARRTSRQQETEYIEGYDGRGTAAAGGGRRGGETHFAQDANPGESLDRKEMLEHLRKAIDALPYYHRQVIVMREIGGMSYEEIAKTTKVSKGTVMSRLFHARRKVREMMNKYLKEDQ